MKVLVRYQYQYKQARDPVKYFDQDTVMLDSDGLSADNLLSEFRAFLQKKRDKLLSQSNKEQGDLVLIDRRYKKPSKYLVKGSIILFLPEFKKEFFKKRLQK